MDQRAIVDSAAVESRSPSARLPGPPCTFPGCEEGLPADTPCSMQECTGWCHYEPCYTRFCDASEFYPGIDTDQVREPPGCMVTYCHSCAIIIRQVYREELEELEDFLGLQADIDDSEATQDFDSDTTQEFDLETENAEWNTQMVG
jgi:hypothetical protein